MTSPASSEQPRLGPDDGFIGRTIGGKWRIERKLGAGGMGTVFLATDLAVDRPVALKFLLPALAAETEYRARFEKEARVMAKVDHPNLVTLYGVERDGEVPFLVMKYVAGRTLARLIKDRTKLSLTEAMPLIKQMGSALGALHSQGYVHRDLKPGNIIVSDDGQVTLLDFGLIRTHEPGLTRPGVTLGSPFYMSPEQAVGETVDARSDLYTLAVVLTELLTGKRPFTETDAHATLLAHLEKPPIPPHELDPAVPPAVSEVLLHALEKRPEARQQSIAAFMAGLNEAAAVSATMVVQVPTRAEQKTVIGGAPVFGASSTPAPKKGDSGRQRVVDEAAKKGPWSDEAEATVSARTRARRGDVRSTDVEAPALGDAAGSKKLTVPETPLVSPADSASTLVGLDVVAQPSQQTLSAVSDVTPSTSATADSSRTLASMSPVESRTDPSTPAISPPVARRVDPLTQVAPPERRRTLLDDATPSWVYVGIGGGTVLIVALLLWILLG